VLVYGAGALGSCAITILRALYPDVEVGVVARFGAQADLARKLGAHEVFAHAPANALIEAAAAWSGGVLSSHTGLPMAFPGGIDVVYDTISRQETLEVSVRLLKAHGTLVKAGVHGTTNWEYTPLYFKEISWVGSNAFGFEEVDGERKHGIQHYLDLARDGRGDHPHVPARRLLARRVRGLGHAGRLRRDQGRLRPAHLTAPAGDGTPRPFHRELRRARIGPRRSCCDGSSPM
jgi:threonine dehydrogenase-like Zn-dependent dehydrogenase